MLPKAMLLDLDDTIISHDQGIDLQLSWTKACRTHLPDYDDTRIEEVIRSIREQARWYWSDPERHRIGRMDLDRARANIISVALEPFNVHDPKLSERIAVDYDIDRNKAVCPFPGAIETIAHLRSAGTKLALLTNGASAAQRAKIERFQLAPYFDCILIEGEFGAGKPDPSVYLHALEQLSVTKEEAWMVGDNYIWEVVAPQSLGIRSIWVNHKGIEPPTSVIPYRTVRTLSEIQSL
ncbi:HAD family hydrolase [Paenibacillus ginsengarvi]|uniref:HAD family hydrolase n=1 Tax=Paenibacillus ginsengarvi TaxID=400777 RepID=A0A3B0CE31_9BACL|nr:HAD family hydrolase [Paenibacillus ginsengarvi]RKN84355.1 HAD family hydrolase [Paenibacillus ginsengarvi]